MTNEGDILKTINISTNNHVPNYTYHWTWTHLAKNTLSGSDTKRSVHVSSSLTVRQWSSLRPGLAKASQTLQRQWWRRSIHQNLKSTAVMDINTLLKRGDMVFRGNGALWSMWKECVSVCSVTLKHISKGCAGMCFLKQISSFTWVSHT